MRTPAPRRITAPPEECRATESRERKRPCWNSTRLPDLIDRSRTRGVACLLSIALFTVTSGFGSLMPLTIYYRVALLATGLLVIGTLRAAAAEEPIPEQIERIITSRNSHAPLATRQPLYWCHLDTPTEGAAHATSAGAAAGDGSNGAGERSRSTAIRANCRETHRCSRLW